MQLLQTLLPLGMYFPQALQALLEKQNKKQKLLLQFFSKEGEEANSEMRGLSIMNQQEALLKEETLLSRFEGTEAFIGTKNALYSNVI